MITKSIKEKIIKLFDETPDYVNVGYGYKIKNGISTGQKSIVFKIYKKLPIDQIPNDEILPSEVEIDGVLYPTDVIEIQPIKTFACDGSTIAQCYNWNVPSGVTNQDYIRPIRGGISLTSRNNQGHVGTLGFVAVDTVTQSLVGVTNNHVVIADAFYTADRNLSGIIENESSDDSFQPGEDPVPPDAYKIGEVVRYVPIHSTTSPFALFNFADVALISLTSTSVSNSVSFLQWGLSNILPLPFATTNEIDNLLITNPPLYSAGRTSGAKEYSPCGLIVNSIGDIVSVSGYTLQGVPQIVYFSDLISFTRINPDCPFPIAPGDSGSALIANFGGVWKIIGLCFAGSDFMGFACRIDNVQNAIGIEAWDGTPKNFINPATKQTVTLPNGSIYDTYACNGKIYWQVGLTNTPNPC